ncbi:MAG: response regulator [Vicinamibacterales bacterium]
MDHIPPSSHPRPDNPTVLVVDDEEVLRRLLRTALSRFGWQVLCAGDGEAALAVLQESADVDVILTDWAMAPMNGEEFCRRLAGRPGATRVPVVVLSAWPLAPDEVDGAPVREILRKPCDLGKLDQALRRHLPQPASAS